jgi:hypothetical protein
MMCRSAVARLAANVCHRHAPVSYAPQHLTLTLSPRMMSTSSPEDSVSAKDAKEYPFYEGFYSKKLKMLRRISISSSFFSVVGLPLVISLGTGDMSVAAKISIASTAVVASVGSTAILHAITHPYVTSLSYVDEEGNGDENSAFKFKATRLTIFGNPKFNNILLSEMKEVRVTDHPYANFQINGKYYYVRHDSIENDILREKIAERCNKK